MRDVGQSSPPWSSRSWAVMKVSIWSDADRMTLAMIFGSSTGVSFGVGTNPAFAGLGLLVAVGFGVLVRPNEIHRGEVLAEAPGPEGTVQHVSGLAVTAGQRQYLFPRQPGPQAFQHCGRQGVGYHVIHRRPRRRESS